jgi:hypothetical protein
MAAARSARTARPRSGQGGSSRRRSPARPRRGPPAPGPAGSPRASPPGRWSAPWHRAAGIGDPGSGTRFPSPFSRSPVSAGPWAARARDRRSWGILARRFSASRPVSAVFRPGRPPPAQRPAAPGAAWRAVCGLFWPGPRPRIPGPCVCAPWPFYRFSGAWMRGGGPRENLRIPRGILWTPITPML